MAPRSGATRSPSTRTTTTAALAVGLLRVSPGTSASALPRSLGSENRKLRAHLLAPTGGARDMCLGSLRDGQPDLETLLSTLPAGLLRWHDSLLLAQSSPPPGLLQLVDRQEIRHPIPSPFGGAASGGACERETLGARHAVEHLP